MPFTLPIPSLQQAALVQTAISLWKFDRNLPCAFNNLRRRDVRTLMTGYPMIEKTICAKVDDLALPVPYKHQLIAIVKLIGREILEWLHLDTQYLLGSIWWTLADCIQFIEWTTHGKVDAAETARTLSKLDKIFTLKQRFTIACAFCVEDVIEAIYHLHSDNLEFLLEDFAVPMWGVVFWCDKLTHVNTVSRHTKFQLLDFFIRCCNVSAVRYMWSILVDEDRDNYLFLSSVKTEYSSSRNCYLVVVGFFMSCLNEKQLEVYFLPLNKVRILRLLLDDWVYVGLFTRVADCVRAQLSAGDVRTLLALTAERIAKNPQDDRYKVCFADLWTHASPRIKKHVINTEIDHPECTKSLYEARDFDNFCLVLNDLSEDDKKFLAAKFPNK